MTQDHDGVKSEENGADVKVQTFFFSCAGSLGLLTRDAA